MTDIIPQHPSPPPAIDWAALSHTTGEIPWAALNGAIDAVAAQPELWSAVAARFGDIPETSEGEPDEPDTADAAERSPECESDEPGAPDAADPANEQFLFLYVPYILGMAIPRLPEPHQGAAIAWLLDCLERVLRAEWDFSQEIIDAAMNVIGPPALAPLMAHIRKVPESESFPFGFWFPAVDIAIAMPADAPARQELEGMVMRLLADPEAIIGDEDTVAQLAAQLRFPQAKGLVEKLLENPDIDAFSKEQIKYSLEDFDGPQQINSREKNIAILTDRLEMLHEESVADSLEDVPADLDPWDDDADEEFSPGDMLDAFDDYPKNERPSPEFAPFVRDEPKVGRNDPCPCGSGKKFKKCCGK